MSTVTADMWGAIYQEYEDSTGAGGLTTLTADATSMYFGEAPVGSNTPFIVVELSSIPQYTLSRLSQPLEHVSVIFTVVDESMDNAGICAICDKIESLYGLNSTALSFDFGAAENKYTHIATQRTNYDMRRENGVWVAEIDCLVRLQKTA